MLNILTRTKPWIVASLLVATSVFGQDSKSCEPKPKNCCVKTCPATLKAPTMAAYDAPARTDTRCSWDVWVDGSFTYWQPIQDNMEIAVAQTDDNNNRLSGSRGDVIQQSTTYKPGFKVGAGWAAAKHDNWDFASEYTWFRSTHKTQSNGQSITYGSGLVSLIPGISSALNTVTQLYNTVSSKWHLGMDLADVNMGRWHYVGTDFTIRPYVGARGAWIRQYRNASFINDSSTGSNSGLVATWNIHDTSHSWAVGPEVGFSSKWMIGEGFRFEGDAQFDMLYTRYTKIGHREDGTWVTTGQSPTSDTITVTSFNTRLHEKSLGTVRNHLDLELGIAWGSYFYNNNWYIDLSATYGFQTFFNQNVFRALSGALYQAPTLANLYVQGLTATVRLDF